VKVLGIGNVRGDNTMIALLLSLFVSANAHAAFIPGAFVPQQCGRQEVDIARSGTHVMQSACVGFINGTTTRAVQFTLSDDTTHLYRVAGQSNLMIALPQGNSMSVFRLIGANGEELTMKAVVLRDGNLKTMMGDFQENHWVVSTLEQMIAIQ
jgi:hypothetical protein